jgi:hypothetical protein
MTKSRWRSDDGMTGWSLALLVLRTMTKGRWRSDDGMTGPDGFAE